MTEQKSAFFLPEGVNLLKPSLDVIFKSLFIRDCEDSRLALIGLVESFLDHPVSEARVIHNELAVHNVLEKFIRMDILCRLDTGELVNIEMQVTSDADDLCNRAEYYLAKLVGSLEARGSSYKSLHKVYQIMISGSTVFPDSKEALHSFTMRTENGAPLEGLGKIMFLELSKISHQTFPLREAEKWGIFIKWAADESRRSLVNTLFPVTKGLENAGRILMTISAEEKAWAIQYEREKAITDYEAFMATVRDAQEALEAAKIEAQAEIDAAQAELQAAKADAKAKTEAAQAATISAQTEAKAAQTEAKAAQTELVAAQTELVAAQTETKAAKEEAEEAKAKLLTTARNMMAAGLDIPLIIQCTGLPLDTLQKMKSV